MELCGNSRAGLDAEYPADLCLVCRGARLQMAQNSGWTCRDGGAQSRQGGAPLWRYRGFRLLPQSRRRELPLMDERALYACDAHARSEVFELSLIHISEPTRLGM